MFVTHRSTYSFGNVIGNTNDIASDCNTITFDNFGDDDCQIFVNDLAHEHTGDFLLLKAGKSIDLGGNVDSVVKDKFDIVFVGLSANSGVNIIKETYQLLT
jgi:hypothetical protein